MHVKSGTFTTARIAFDVVTNRRDLYRFIATLKDGQEVSGIFRAPFIAGDAGATVVEVPGASPENPVTAMRYELVAVEVQPHVVRRPNRKDPS